MPTSEISEFRHDRVLEPVELYQAVGRGVLFGKKVIYVIFEDCPLLLGATTN